MQTLISSKCAVQSAKKGGQQQQVSKSLGLSRAQKKFARHNQAQ